jgi:hypothetical protein
MQLGASKLQSLRAVTITVRKGSTLTPNLRQIAVSARIEEEIGASLIASIYMLIFLFLN